MLPRASNSGVQLRPRNYKGEKMTKKITKQQIIDWATSRGWKLDKWGHLQKEINGKQYRFKLSSTAMRYEFKVHHPGGQYGGPSSEWVRLRSGYYKDISFTPEGKISGLR